MVDITSPEFIWEELSYCVARKEHPSAPDLAKMVSRALNQHNVPPDVRDYIAARIRGDVQLPGLNHRPAMDDRTRWERARFLRDEVRRHQAAFRLRKVKTPKERALWVVARLYGFTSSSLETIIKRDLKDAAPSMKRLRPMKEVEEEVTEWVESGDFVWDRDGGFTPTDDDAPKTS